MLFISSDAPLSLFLFLGSRHHNGQLTFSHSSLRVKYLQQRRRAIIQELFFIFHLFYFILCVCFSPPPPTDLEQLSNLSGSSALTITTKV